jgi:hypothetical protein
MALGKVRAIAHDSLWLAYNEPMVAKQKNTATVVRREVKNDSSRVTREATPVNPQRSASKKALHLCLDRLKNAKDEIEVRRLTEELQKIVFHKQYGNAEN